MIEEIFCLKTTSINKLEAICKKIASNIITSLKTNSVDLNKDSFNILLEGNLGSGKTTLTQNIIKYLGYQKPVSSPTFTIMKEYQFNDLIVHHFDLYRNSNDEPNYDLIDYMSFGINFIEWPLNCSQILPKNYILIEISTNLDNENRIFSFSTNNSFYKIFLKNLKGDLNEISD